MKPRGKFKPGYVALERALSKLGIASRTQARQWIMEGKVRVDGVLRRSPDFAVVPERARIEVDGKKVEKAPFKIILLHKPKGVVTTRSDEKGRPTVFSLLPDFGHHMNAVGRLDFATTGLLLLTSDSRLASWLTDPANAIPRTYVVTVRGEVTAEKLEHLKSGVQDAGEILAPEQVTLRKASGRESHLVVTLTEGKNREIRRMFLVLGNEVTRLKRVAYGDLELGDLAPGQFRELQLEELRRAFPSAPISSVEI